MGKEWEGDRDFFSVQNFMSLKNEQNYVRVESPSFLVVISVSSDQKRENIIQIHNQISNGKLGIIKPHLLEDSKFALETRSISVKGFYLHC